MTRKQRYLAKLRAWIDRQLPRDVLRITIYGLPEHEDDTTKLLLNIAHPHQILACKMSGENDGEQTYTYRGNLMITFRVEHLTP